MPSAVARLDPGDGDQPSDLFSLHGVDESAGDLGQERHLTERACRRTKCADYRVPPPKGLA